MNKALLFSLLISLSFAGALLAMDTESNDNNDNASPVSNFKVLEGLFDDNKIRINETGVDPFFEHFQLNKESYSYLISDAINRIEIFPSKSGLPFISGYYPSQTKLGAIASTLNQIEENDFANIEHTISWRSPTPEEDIRGDEGKIEKLSKSYQMINNLFAYCLRITKKHPSDS